MLLTRAVGFTILIECEIAVPFTSSTVPAVILLTPELITGSRSRKVKDVLTFVIRYGTAKVYFTHQPTHTQYGTKDYTDSNNVMIVMRCKPVAVVRVTGRRLGNSTPYIKELRNHIRYA